MRAVAALIFAVASLAIEPVQAASDEPPARVGRISWTSGEVALYSDPEQGWEKAYINSPLTSENSLWTEPGARAEIRIGPITVRLDEATQLDIRRLDDDELRAHVVRGTVTVRVRELDRGERFTISTPNARFSITAAGRYRLDAEEDRGQSVITVFSGAAQVEAGRIASISGGEAVRVREDGEHFDFERVATTPFDDWSASRDQRVERVVQETVRYVSPQMTGYEDLAEHGQWATEPDYGAVWYPRVNVGYVPYRDGRWVHVRPWGWTWVDNAPWGYAPFHYGRWVYVGNRWGWSPGRYQRRPVWAPALVGWVGTPGFSIAVSGGSSPALGWYPLSPWDRYRPWYTNNTRYINNVNIIVNNPPRGRDRDRDGHRDRGATVVLREDFVRQRPVTQSIARVSGEAVREAVRAQPVVSNPAQVLPGRLEIQRPPQTRVPAQVGGQVVGGGAPRSVSKPVFTPSPTAAQPAPVAPRVVTPAPAATRPSVGGEAVRPDARGSKPMRDPSPQPQVAPPVAQPQALQPRPASPPPPAATRPAQPVELREERRRPAPQGQQPLQAVPATRPVQPAPQPQAQPQVQQGGEAVRATRPAPKPQVQPQPQEKPQDDKPDKPDKPNKTEKPGSGGRER